MVTATVANILAVHVFAVVVPEKKCHPVGVLLLERDNLPEVLDGTLRGYLVIDCIEIVRVQVVPEKDKPLPWEPLGGLLPERSTVNVRDDNDFSVSHLCTP